MADFKTSAGASDNRRFHRSKVINTGSAGTYDAIYLPKFSFIFNVYAWVKTVMNQADITIGYRHGATSDTDGVMTAAFLAPGKTGFSSAAEDDIVGFEGFWLYSASGAITVTLGGTLSSGELIIFCDYAIIH